jgi:hypothetical protein
MKNKTKLEMLSTSKVMSGTEINGKLGLSRDGIVRAVRVTAGKSNLERTIQQLYPMELSCDRTTPKTILEFGSKIQEQFRPRRHAATTAKENIQIIAEEETEEH